MRSDKPFTNTTFSKRVDREAGRHRPPRGIKEPAVCSDCGAVYVNRRWSLADSLVGNKKHKNGRPARTTVCPACKQKRAGEPRGFVFLDGAFFVQHQTEIKRLLFNEAERATEDNPLARILECKEDEEHQLTVTTTTEHLAQRLGHTLEKAFGGSVQYDFSHENKLARVSWRREH
jgi:undecaprenyl pyrophosphate synthase